MSVEGKSILKAKVENFTLSLQWLDGEWQQWQELQDDNDVKTMQAETQQRLDRAKGAASDSKGKGKGPVS